MLAKQVSPTSVAPAPSALDRVKLHLWITPKLRQALLERALRDEESLSSLVRRALRQYVGEPRR